MAARAAGDPPALRPLRTSPAAAAAPSAEGARGAAGRALRLERLDDPAAARAEWSGLAERSGNVFSTWEFADTWWRHFGGRLRPAIAVARDPTGSPRAVLPLCLRGRRPLTVARFIGYGPADELGPVADRADAPAAGRALAGSARELGWDVLLAERLAPGHAIPGRPLRRESSPVISTPAGGWEEYLAGRSRNLRSQLRRKLRALQREHGLRFRLGDDPARLEEDMAALIRLHEARWREGGSGALSGARAAFHREFAALALERGWLRLWLAEAGGRTVAAWYGFRFAGTESYYQSGRDPAWDRSSVGLVLLAHTMSAAMDDGMREYRLLRGGEAYKDRFATSDPGLETIVSGRRAGARALALLGRAAAGLPESVRRRLR